jgi:predicted TPR repeat methyltransferase
VADSLLRTLLHRLTGGALQRRRNISAAIEEGKRLSVAGEHANAARAFEQALAIDPHNAEAHFRLGLAARDQQQLERAATAYRRAIELRPGYIEAHNNLGSVLQMQGINEEALEAYRRAVALVPDFAQPYLNLGRLYAAGGDRDNAAATFQQAIARGIDVEIFNHLLSALRGETTGQAPDDYTRSLFDNFAGDFDRRLVDELGYRIPETMAARIKTIDPRRNLRVLDLGCGTGLCGVQLAGCFTQLTGVDLSSAMLKKARARNLYTELIDASLGEWLETAPSGAFDLVLAADVLVYFGDLAALFAQIASVLGHGGHCAFSIELSTTNDYVLQPSGRYAHTADYVRKVCGNLGLREIEAFPHHIRGDVNGFVFILRKD